MIAREPIVETPKPSDNRPPVSNRPHKGIWKGLVVLLVLGAAAWYGVRLYKVITATTEAVIPTAKVQRGDVSLIVTARGDIRGGNPETLTAPQTGGSDMHITYLRNAGEAVKEGDIVVQFDTTEQDYKLREAEA